MAQALQVSSISAPGFYGLNTQDSPLDLAAGFALNATNCIIDQYGRIGSRKGYTKVNASSGAVGSNDIQALHELIQSDGTATVLFAANNKLFKLNSSNVVVELTYGGGGSAPTISANNWSIATLNNIAYFFQTGHDPLIYDPAVSTTTYRRVSEKTGYSGTVPSANIVLSAYGRLWVANTSTDKVTISFSDLLAGHIWDTGTAGSLDVSRVWGEGVDEIQALAYHNGYLFIFGKNQILVYKNATTPEDLVIDDAIIGTGCIARDSVKTIGTDVLFLSNTGVRSLMRTIQEKSLPFRDLSKNVRNDLMTIVSGEDLSKVKAVFSERNAFYLLTLPSVEQIYCFDTRGQLQDSSVRVTVWNSIDPQSLYSRANGDLLFGKTGYVVQYTGYQDDGVAYRLQYYTNYADLGNVAQTSVLKKISVVVIGGTNQYVTIKWAFDLSSNYLSDNAQIPIQGISEYGTAEYGSNGSPVAYYSNGQLIQTLTVSATGAGKLVQTGYESNINGAALSIQKIEIQAKNGKLS
jgi:hypothetical protein